ncbi:MAG: shikimate kinase [Pseudomonadota bacterium]
MNKKRNSEIQRISHLLDGRSVVMLGMMGSGKSAIGKMAARSLGLAFRDADTEIENAAGRSVADIFAEYGEPEFRRLETRVIERLLNDGPVLIALGGGAYMAEETRQVVSEKALSIWLKADINVLLERVSRRPGKRPLLKTGNPREILLDLLAKREPIYALAELHIQSQKGSKADMRDFVLKTMHDHLSHQMKATGS